MDYNKAEDEYLHKIIIAAATTLAMTCFKRILVLFFVEQWRSRVFLVLNLVLVAIFVTSIRSAPSENEEISGVVGENTKDQVKKRRKECGISESEKSHIGEKEGKGRLETGRGEEEEEEEESKNRELSKEELNERVEAFIAMFRQHLVSDAKRGKNGVVLRPKQAEMVNFKLTNSSGQLKSITVPHRHSFSI